MTELRQKRRDVLRVEPAETPKNQPRTYVGPNEAEPDAKSPNDLTRVATWFA